MTTKWQETAIESAARRYPKIGSKDDRDIWISTRDEAVARLPVGEAATEETISAIVSAATHTTEDSDAMRQNLIAVAEALKSKR